MRGFLRIMGIEGKERKGEKANSICEDHRRRHGEALNHSEV